MALAAAQAVCKFLHTHSFDDYQATLNVQVGYLKEVLESHTLSHQEALTMIALFKDHKLGLGNHFSDLVTLANQRIGETPVNNKSQRDESPGEETCNAFKDSGKKIRIEDLDLGRTSSAR